MFLKFLPPDSPACLGSLLDSCEVHDFMDFLNEYYKMIVFNSTAKEMIVAVIFPLKSWNISIILHLQENIHVIFQIKEYTVQIIYSNIELTF